MATNFVNIMLLDGLNYFNRIIKKYDTLTEYQALGSHSYSTSLNFDPGNGLQTTLVIGTQSTSALNFDANYLLVYTTTENVSTISQRWWVMDQKRTRSGQYTLSLKRDVIADFQGLIVNSPCFIEKATIRDITSPLLFNKEDMTLNQIKKKETFLKDETGMAWIVGYIARNYTGTAITTVYDIKTDYTDVTIPFAVGQTYKGATSINLHLGFRINYYYQLQLMASYNSDSRLIFSDSSFTEYGPDKAALKYVTSSYNPKYVYYKNYNQQGQYYDGNYDFLDDVADGIIDDAENCQTDFETQYGLVSPEDIITIMNLDGKTYRDTNTGKYYKLHIQKNVYNRTVNLQSSSAFGTRIDSAVKIPVNNNTFALTPDYNNVGGYTVINYAEQNLFIGYEEFIPTSLTFTIPDTRKRLVDAPYDMFAIPYPLSPDFIVKSYTDEDTYEIIKINKWDSIHIAQAIGQALGSNVYDIQILPYCPVTNIMGNFTFDGDPEVMHKLSLLPLTDSKDYTLVKDGDNTNIGIIYFATQSGITFDIPYPIIVTEPKIDNETKMYRLVSPNYSGMFEFSPAMNMGVDYFNVDVTFKPYQPYIHVNPNFKHMYGKDFNDVRGLVCGGDYSVAIISDKWVEFEINNKNYQMIFDREVQNMEFNREQDRVVQAVGMLTGTVQGSAQGGMAGGWVGALVGGVASAAGGATDFIMAEQKYKEQLSLKKDLYGYNLGNIRALPYSLTKSMSLNENFKFWPFLEEYECSFEEQAAFRSKLYYDGMTVMKVGTMAEYIEPEKPSFIKGQMIRLEGLHEAADVAYEIFNEIKRGVFI